MARFVTKVALFLLPLIVAGVAIEFLVRNIPNDYSYKRNFLDNNSNDIEILFLGSSHTYYGVNPGFFTSNSFNASHISQSIDYDYEILAKYDGNWDRVKYIVVPIDYFTLFSNLSDGIESWRVKDYEIYYDLDKSSLLVDHSELLSVKHILNLEKIYSYYCMNKSLITCSKLGYGGVDQRAQNLLKTGIEAATRHTKSDTRYLVKNIDVLKQLIDFAKRGNIKVLFYTTPAFHTYVSNLNKKQLDVTIQVVSDLVNDNLNCSYHNFLSDKSFDEADFMDADHLNDAGAKKLSLKLSDIIEQ